MRFSPGDTFNRYVIEALVGEGGMGEVYRAADTRLGRKVALKVLRAEGEGDSDTAGRAVARMQREARAVAALSHPSIVAVYDVGEHEGTPFISMEFVQGEPLRAFVGKDLPTSARIGILIDVAKALAAAHRAGIVHRDVKPENVIVREGFSAKVLDFGVARFSPPVAATSSVLGAFATMTAEGSFVGTPAYMAPEQLRGEAIDARADQFAFGVLTYELFSGKLPFRSEKGAVSLMASILSDPAPPLEGAPGPIAEIVARALEKAPEDRFESMDDIASQLSALITGEVLPLAQRTPPSRRAQHAKGEALTADPSAPPPPRPSHARRPRLALRTLAVLPPVLAALAALVWFGLKNHSPLEGGPAPLASSPPPPAVVATAVTDLPVPASESAEAKLAFREGLQAVRDATWDSAIDAFDRARKADPGMAEAHFRYAILNHSLNLEPAREAFRKAIGLRASLSERDQAMLDALEPAMLRDPPDDAAAVRKLEAVSARYPGDAELVFWRARTAMYLSERARAAEVALALTTRCLELDPKYADCWQTKENALVVLGRDDEALAALDQCAEVAAGAVDCLSDKAQIEASLGRCSAAMRSTRRWIAKDPSSAKAYMLLAAVLYHEREPALAVRLAVDEAGKRHRDTNAAFGIEELEIQRAMAFGDLLGVLRGTEKTLATALPTADSGASLWLLRAAAFAEMGKYDEAARVADEFFSNSAVRADLRGPGMDAPVVLMHAARLRVGKESRAEYEAARAAWLSHQDRSSTDRKRRAFLHAYALPAHSRAMAEEALEKATELAPLGEGAVSGMGFGLSAQLGRLLLLVGKPADALPHLEWSASGCYPFHESLAYIRALANLGIAREETGDAKRACDAYRHVLSYWGGAKESVMAKDVARRAKALSCEPPRGP